MERTPPFPYEDIISLLYPFPLERPRMAREARAAQFAPFAALSGLEEDIAETGRLTEKKRELDVDEKAAVNEKLQLICARLHAKVSPIARICFFRPDEKKAGGAYVSVTGPVKRIDDVAHTILLKSGQTIPIEDIVGVEIDP